MESSSYLSLRGRSLVRKVPRAARSREEIEAQEDGRYTASIRDGPSRVDAAPPAGEGATAFDTATPPRCDARTESKVTTVSQRAAQIAAEQIKKTMGERREEHARKLQKTQEAHAAELAVGAQKAEEAEESLRTAAKSLTDEQKTKLEAELDQLPKARGKAIFVVGARGVVEVLSLLISERMVRNLESPDALHGQHLKEYSATRVLRR